jgi:hypothetical protein
MDEHRTFKRTSVNIRIAYRNNEYAFKIGRVSDVSKGGIFITPSSTTDGRGDYLTASMDLEDLGKVVWIQGRITRKTGTGMGVVFTRIDSKGLELFLSYLGSPS